MKIRSIKPTQIIYVCNHIFEKTAKISLFGREPEGDLVATCGCEVREAHVIGFEHISSSLEEILDRPVPVKGSALAYKPDAEKWVIES